MFSTLRCNTTSGKDGFIDYSHRPASDEGIGIHHTACEHCRSKKLRCSGDTPCKRCAAKAINCQYPTTPKGRRRRATGTQKPAAGGAGTTSTLPAAEPWREAESQSAVDQEPLTAGSAGAHDSSTLFSLHSNDTQTPDGVAGGLLDDQNDNSQHLLLEYDKMLDFDDLGTPEEFADHLWPPLLSPSLEFASSNHDLFTLQSLTDDASTRKEGTTTGTNPFFGPTGRSSGARERDPMAGITCANARDDIRAKDNEVPRLSLLSSASTAPLCRTPTNHTGIALSSPLPKTLNQACQCLEQSSKLVEAWEGRRHDWEHTAIDSLLNLQRQTAQQCNLVLTCEYCSTRSSSLMLPLMLCEKLVCSFEHYNESYLFAGAGKGKLGDFEIQTPQEWAHVMRMLATLQSKATRDLIRRYRVVALSAGWQTQLSILVNIEERFHSIVQSHGVS
ncbi:hypothetical protein K458DRAFT_395935 [Lentithecium fluviatile CBS 122367]|uniref:Zn(2)-C6 fungal-type domain-containing protein n=1 Tax=Lentithecium fluviatile CBS 122367 TaxID=1168545 RepID=A0A6G1IH73_9PLEO|nr:hypothetical protein K458DRAFT_395935 [Lentithecium fluviatile CBS 122367]